MNQNDSIKQILLDMRSALLSRKKILTVSELQGYSGLSKSSIYKLTSSRKIPHFKNAGGKLIFFLRSDIDKWLLAHCIFQFNYIPGFQLKSIPLSRSQM